MTESNKDKSNPVQLSSNTLRLMPKRYFKWFSAIYVLAIAGFAIYTSLTGEFRTQSDRFEIAVKEAVEASDKEIYSLRERITILESAKPIEQAKLDSVINAIEKFEKLDAGDAATAFKELGTLKEQVGNFKEDLEKLKNSLNPNDPTDVLTVARLGDQFHLLNTRMEQFNTDVTDLEDSIDEKTKRNFDLVDSQVDRIVDMLKWLGLLLIPVVLNTLKSFLDGDDKKQNGEKASTNDSTKPSDDAT